MSEQGPIADLTYRNYDGPKSLHKHRWRPIALSAIKVGMKKKSFWWLASVSGIPYFIPMIILLVKGVAPDPATLTGRGGMLFAGVDAHLAGAFGNWFFPFLVALLLGSGCIAADNRANALQVYLSKPLYKIDYLIGKWLGIFVPLYCVIFVPMLLLVLFGMFDEGIGTFFSNHGSLLLKVFILPAIPAAAHASVLVGLSAWNKTPWIVGLIYTAGYFMMTAFAGILFLVTRHQVDDRASSTLLSLSLQGSISGIGFSVIGAMPPEDFVRVSDKPFPDTTPLFFIWLGFCVLGLWLAYYRIRAVDVVTS